MSDRGNSFPDSTGQQRRAIIIIALIIASVTMLVYLPALQNDFLLWDDDKYVYANPYIQTLGLRFLWDSLSTIVVSNWHPVTFISHALDYKIFGLNPAGHHFTSILIHSINTFLVALLAFRLTVIATRAASEENSRSTTRALVVAAFTAILFGLHPSHVESVAWVSERKDLLCALFYLLTLLSYLRYAVGKQRRYYVFSLVTFMLALMSKPMAVSLPLVLIILDIYPLGALACRGKIKRVLLEKTPFFLLSALIVIVTLWTQSSSGAMSTLDSYSTTSRLLVAVRAFVFYLYKLIWPADLSPFYPYPVEISLFSLEFGVSLLIFLSSAFLALYFYRRRRAFSAAWLYYLVTLLPVIGIVQVGEQAAADRYTYLPSISLFMLFGLLVYHFSARYREKVLTTVVIAAVVMGGLLSYKTHFQMLVWRDSVTLWSSVIEKYPAAVPGPYNNRGLAYKKQGDYNRAMADFSEAIEVDPDHILSYINRGTVYRINGTYNRAIADFTAAIELNPRSSVAYNNLGVVYAYMNDYAKAISNFSKAVEIKPNFKTAQNNLKRALMLESSKKNLHSPPRKP